MKDVEEEIKKNNYQIKSSNMRTLNKIIGDNSSKKNAIRDSIVKRMDRKWVVGKQIATDGTVINSPGLAKLMELKETVDKMPLNFNFEKKMIRNVLTKPRHFPEIKSGLDRLGEQLL